MKDELLRFAKYVKLHDKQPEELVDKFLGEIEREKSKVSWYDTQMKTAMTDWMTPLNYRRG